MPLKMKEPSAVEWRRLYELAEKLKELAPWTWMDETEVFGVENQKTKEIGFVSIMGALGEHFALGLYLGAAAFYKFQEYCNEEDFPPDSMAFLEIPQLQISFEDRSQLAEQDHAVIKKLGLKFRGKRSYPMFRSMRQGFMPWFISSDEAQFLIYAIEQALEVTPRIKEDPMILIADDDPKGEVYLVRIAESRDGKLVWRDEIKRISRPVEKKTAITVPLELIDRLKSFQQDRNLVFEMDLFYLPIPIGKKGERPVMPKMLMVSDANSFFVLGAEFLEPCEDITETYSSVADCLLKMWSRHEVLPAEIRVGSDLLFKFLKSFVQRLNIGVRQTNQLFAIKDAKNAIIGQFLGTSS